MMWLNRFLIALYLPAAVGSVIGKGQEPSPIPGQTEANYEFFSGTIVQLPEGKITVSRAVLGKPAEERSFIINGDTKIEGKLKAKVRVTVGFKPSQDGDLAVRIIVRAAQSKK
jgi:hypothetical protein